MNLEKKTVTAIAAVLISFSTAAWAQPYGYMPQHEAGPPPHHRMHGPGPQMHDRGGPDYRRGPDHYGPRPQHYGYRSGPPPMRDPRAMRPLPPPPPPPQAGFYAGYRLPYGYRQYYPVVSHWNAYPGLTPPPRGYHWIQHGPDFALVAIATGVIASVILTQD